MEEFHEIGVDTIGVGLDAAAEKLFRTHRSDVPAGGAGLSWDKYWAVVGDASEVFGPGKVNCHVLVGLGETDRHLADLFFRLRDMEVLSCLFWVRAAAAPTITPVTGPSVERSQASTARAWTPGTCSARR